LELLVDDAITGVVLGILDDFIRLWAPTE